MRLWISFTPFLVLFIHCSILMAATTRKETCQLSEDQGPCRGIFTRWFFNLNTKKCESFIYGGCGGNTNNFRNKFQCLKTCSNKVPCTLPKDDGSCRLFIQHWFYNSTSTNCEPFIYGGCEGNDNNFHFKKDCMSICKGQG